MRALAASRVPTVSAVGHEIDVTLADLAADVRALTPSEAAERVVPSAQEVTEVLHTLRARLRNSLTARATQLRSRLDALASRPALARPLDGIHNWSRQVDELATRLHGAAKLTVREQQSRLTALSGKLDTLSPLGVLGRGYSLTQDEQSGQLVTSTKQLQAGQRIVTRLAAGTAVSTIDEIRKATR